MTVPDVRRGEVHEEIAGLAGLERFDYADLFIAPTREPRSPEQWARAGIEDAAGIGGQVAWQGVLGLRLARASTPDHVGGWRIGGRGDDWIRLEAASWCLTARIVVYVEERRLSVATFIRYDNRMAPLVWGPVSIVHRNAMPRLLRAAVRSQPEREEARA